MATFLNETIADGLCTTILVGYVTTEVDAGTETTVSFQYEQPDEKADYERARDKINGIVGSPKMTVSQSTSQAALAFIGAATSRVPNAQSVKGQTDELGLFVNALHERANQQNPVPYGAYIGGMSTISTLFVVGPSVLDTYTPVFRTADGDPRVDASYAAAVQYASVAYTAVQQAQRDFGARAPKVKLDFQHVSKPGDKPLQKGQLFKSYHGMIQAMAAFQTNFDRNAFYFEIAMGGGTTKVSSCFPCSMFMTANGTPPTSRHLGRGDNWNIPPGASAALVTAWETKVKSWYAAGRAALERKGQLEPVFAALDANAGADNGKIPGIFLEALTFQKKFTERVNASIP